MLPAHPHVMSINANPKRQPGGTTGAPAKDGGQYARDTHAAPTFGLEPARTVDEVKTLQTDAPLVHSNMQGTYRQARELTRQVREGEVILDAPYQRGSVWTTDQRRNLVRSWLLGLPIPAVIMNSRQTTAWRDANGQEDYRTSVVDGKQRIEAALAWFEGDLDVPASWFDPKWVESTHDTVDGPYVAFSELTLAGGRFTSNRSLITVCDAQVASVADEAVVFGLVNGAGTAQTGDTMERAARIAAGTRR